MGGISAKTIISGIIAIFFLVGMGSTFFPAKLAWAEEKEIRPNEVQVKVISIYTNVFRKGTIVVKSDQTRKTYTFYGGGKPSMFPGATPA